MPRKSAIYNIVDVFISELQLRFIADFYGILPLEGLIPSKKAIHNGNDIIHAALKYNWYFRSSEFQLKSEFKILGAKSDNMVKLHQKWDENNMNEAIEKVITMEMIIREASERYSVPKRTIRDKVKDFAEGEKVTRFPLLFVFPRVRLDNEFKKDASLGSGFDGQPSGWITAEHFLKWLKMFVERVNPSEKNPVLLIVDGLSSHKDLNVITFTKEDHIHMLRFPPHTSQTSSHLIG
ncbi:hypothetical protein AVEN_128681-1 [Araneus ventricosus]|uniref:DDE-1 domain-containing protein n=1 Tax=Araneus ventricosus TaxID=182803 RepID=A0A4Y2UL75_ARAVE|nr:hypothetical protein AVEN_28432-1 [Araneus ventricosus]GBO12956.1 hypothetical protein AVEN_128681-1 [Araneus ventricosus]